MYQIVFTPRGERELRAFPRDIQQRILRKLEWLSRQDQPLHFAKPLVNLPPATHRFRISTYRVAFYLAHHTLFIERVELRGQAYRR